MELSKRVVILDDLLGSDLGRNVFGEPLYKWQYSETFLHHYLSETEWEDAFINGLWVRQRKVMERKMCPSLNDQWLVAMWSDAGSQDSWNDAFGDRLPWPRRGYYAPTNVALNPSELPDLSVTQEIIGLIRRQRSKTYADYMRESESSLEQTERSQLSTLDSRVQDACTAFGNAKPGSRSGGVSFPLVNVGGKGTKTEVADA